MDTKDEILAAADVLFADRGYNVSMSDIAKKVGIKVPSLYSHYSGKDEIILLVVEREINRFYSFVLEEIHNMNTVSCEESLEKIYRLILHYYRQENRLRFWWGISLIQNVELKRECGILIRENEKLVSQELNEIFSKGMQKGRITGIDAKEMVFLFFVVLKGVMHTMIVYQNTETDMDLFLNEIWNEYWFLIKSKTFQEPKN